MVIGSFSISASSMEASICGSAAVPVLRLPGGVPLPNCFLISLISPEILSHCFSSEPSSSKQAGALLR